MSRSPVNRRDPSGTKRIEREEIKRQREVIRLYTEAMARVVENEDPETVSKLGRLTDSMKEDLEAAADSWMQDTVDATVETTSRIVDNLHVGITLGNAVPIPREEVDMLRANIHRVVGLEGDEILSTVTRVITEGYQEGIGAHDMAKAINAEIPDFQDRAERIVRTETMRVCDVVAKARYVAAGCDGYISFPTDDDRLCTTCLGYATGGSGTTLKIYGMDEPMALPWHPNCRCCRLPHFEGQEEITI